MSDETTSQARRQPSRSACEDCGGSWSSEVWHGGPPKSDETTIQARKQHRCCSCRTTIEEGETYVRVWSSDSASKICLKCHDRAKRDITR